MMHEHRLAAEKVSFWVVCGREEFLTFDCKSCLVQGGLAG